MNHASDRTKLIRLQNRILARKGLVCCGSEFTVAIHSRGKAVFVGANRYGQGDVTAYEEVASLACTSDYTVALMKDGTLRLPTPTDTRLAELAHIRTVSCSSTHIAALLGNGRVVVGIGGADYQADAVDTSEWPAVLDVVCGKNFVAGLTSEGRVLVAGGSHRLRYAVSRWSGVAGLFADLEGEHLYAVTVDGYLLSTARLPRAVRAWRNLVFVAASGKRIMGVTATGQLCANCLTPSDPDEKAHFVACAVSPRHAAAFTRDGLVLAAGDNDFGQCNTRRFGTLFTSFEEFAADRRERYTGMIADEREYQVRLTEAYRYGNRIACGERLTACITADGRVLSSVGFNQVKQWTRVRAVACGNAHIVALHEGGTVSADGNDAEGCTAVSDWTGIKSIAAGKYHTLGLTEDGRVLFCGRNHQGQGDVTAWTGIRRIYAADTYTVGVGFDGSIRIAGTPPFKPEIIDEYWKNPTDMVVTSTHAVALYADGRVRSTRLVPASTKPGDGEVSDTCSFPGIRAIAAGEGFTVGLCYGGHVVAVGNNEYGQCDVSDWKNVVAVACGNRYTVGLTSDGRLLSAGRQRIENLVSAPRNEMPRTTVTYEFPAVDDWQDVLAVTCGPEHTVAINREGQILATGLDADGQCTATAHFTLFRDVRQLYGYGKYRKLAECGPAVEQTKGDGHTIREDPQAILPFAQFSAHLRADTARLLTRLAGSDDLLTVLDENGTPITYRYETAETFRESWEAPISRMVAVGDGTLYISSEGMARERRGCTSDAPVEPLPNRLGDNHHYRVADMAVGDAHRAILLRDGTVRTFGENDRGQCETNDWKNIIAVSAGESHTVGLRADGTVVATGARRRDSGSYTRGIAHLPRANPCAVEDWAGVQSVICACNITVGLCHNGTVKAVGSSHYGQCNTDHWRGVVSVATSGRHTAALFADGHVEAVGMNENGECRTEGWSRIIQIAVMPELTLGLRADGKIMAAGRHHNVLETLDTVRAIACFGTRRQVFIMSDGSIRIHIRGSEFLPEPVEGLRLFTPSQTRSVLDRHTVNTVSPVTARAVLSCFDVGMTHTVTLGKAGLITANGGNDGGQCDLKVYGNAVQVAAGPYHSAAILSDGTLVLSGRNTHGQSDARSLNRELNIAGVSAEEARHSSVPTVGEPDPIHLPYAWRQVSCGYTHTAALRTDGRVYAIGENPDGRCDTRKWRDVIHVTCGVRHTVACTHDGTCVAAGDNRYGQCDVSLWKNITMTAAGEFHTVGLRADGRVEAAGDNRKGQCHVEDLRDIISVACLPEATLCVTSEGRVIIRGGSGEHDKAVEALREIIAIHTCEHRIAALTVDRRMILIP